MQRIAAASVVGLPAVNAVGPARQLAAVLFVEISYSLDIGAVIARRPRGFKLNAVFAAHTLQNIEHRLALVYLDLHSAEDNSVGRQNVEL